MQQLPVTIHKTLWGSVGIFLLGVACLGVLFAALLDLQRDPWADPAVMFATAVLVVALSVAFITIWLWVYSLSHLTISDQGVTVVRWSSLFHRQTVATEWSDIQDVSAVTSGFFAQMLGFGTLNIQTAGSRQTIRMVMIPQVEYWAGLINGLADEATA